uniref:Uncharacterized protein n=1 Tax=Hyaloperonospora arabidopsidis (strain Emoy2) TaxID=559515 RepID=M4C3H2_HYAAE
MFAGVRRSPTIVVGAYVRRECDFISLAVATTMNPFYLSFLSKGSDFFDCRRIAR